MAITLISSGVDNVPNGVNTTITIPGSPAQDDLCVVLLGNGFANDADITGYTSLGRALGSLGTPGAELFAKKLGASETTFDALGIGGSQAVAIWVLRGQDLTTFSDVAATTASLGNTSAVDSPSITPVTNAAWVGTFGVTEALSLTPTAPSGYGNLQFKENSGTNHTAMGAWKELAVAAAEDPGAFGSSGSNSVGAISWAVRPATGGGGSIVGTPFSSPVIRGARRIGRVVAGTAIMIPTLHQVLHFGSKVI